MTNTKGHRVLVTGGAGFLGSHLVDRLLARGDHVIALDSLQTGSWRNLARVKDQSKLELVTHDVTIPRDFAVDQIYNLACPASPVHYQADPIRTMRTSLLGALNLLELAQRRGVRIFQASTSEVYGDPAVHPQPESYFGNVNPTGIRSCYDEGKRAAETLFFDYHRTYGLDIKVVRIFNTYGPRMHPQDGRVVSNFVVQALKGEPLTVFGDGSQTRSFCYVDDLVKGFMRMMDSGIDIIGPINLGNPNEFTMLELAEKILGQTKSKSKLVRLPLPQDDPKQRCPDITIAKRDLNWTPRVELDEGLSHTIHYFKSIAAA
jgi:UDP-glucuronate decarboxylase